MSEPVSDATRIQQIFFPHGLSEWKRVRGNPFRLAYYTTAETAFRILKNHEIWMRNTMTMNDSMEVEHGLKCLVEAYQSQYGNSFKEALNSCFQGLADEVGRRFDAWAPGMLRDTFVTCFSEHLPNEDKLGRLSMWRAYGGNAGVALIMNGHVMANNSRELATYLSPVAYMEPFEVGNQLKNISTEILAQRKYVISLGREKVGDILFEALRFAAVCNKHAGFKEEREWRVVAFPVLQSSDLLPYKVEVINGIPQRVLKIKLQNVPDRNLVLALPELLDRIIIGPCNFPHVIFQALHDLLKEAGIQNPNERIVVSDIPLRVS
jgi:hypothetical protein